MKLTPDQLADAADLAKKNPIVKALLEHYNFVTQSQAYESYVIRVKYTQRWNTELDKKDVDLINTKEESDNHDKAVDRAFKYFDTQLDFLKDTEAIKAMLNPEEKTRAAKDTRIKESGDLVFGVK